MPEGAPELTDVSMRFQWIPQWQFAGYIAAQVRGYYEEEGLNVTLNAGGPDFPTKQLVASGSDDFGTAWVDSMYLSRQRGVPLVAVLTMFQTSPSAFMVHADSGIEGPEDFVGKTVAVYYGGGEETEYIGMLNAAGVERDQVNEVPGQFSLEPFLQRRIDVLPVYATDQPNKVRNQGVDIRLIHGRDYGVVMMGDVLFATEEFIARYPNTVQAFVDASLRGWNWAVENPDEAVALVADYNPELDPEQLTFEAQETIELLTYGAGERCIGWNDPQAWETQRQLLLDLELLEEPVSFEDAANNTFVENYYAAQGIDCSVE
jgi:ABC-type nitrate/sulfonate/bicarbonate transport system substrate-binding protein